MVSKFRNIETIGTSTKCDGDITALSLGVKNFIYFVDISFASKFSYRGDAAKLMPIFGLSETTKKTRKYFLALKCSEMAQSIYDKRLQLSDIIKQALLANFCKSRLCSIEICQLRL